MSLSDLSTEDVEAMFDYLDELRASGATNMYGARPYLVEEYPSHARYAVAVLSAWIATFDRDHTPFERALKAMDASQ